MFAFIIMCRINHVLYDTCACSLLIFAANQKALNNSNQIELIIINQSMNEFVSSIGHYTPEWLDVWKVSN